MNLYLVGKNSAPWLPPVLFGSSCIIAGFLCYTLPDTQGVPLMETLEEAEKFYRNPEVRKIDVIKVNEL